MGSTERRFAPWLDVVAEVVRQPHGEFPHGMLMGLLAESFQETVGWNSFGPRRFVVEVLGGPSGWPTPEVLDLWARHVHEHPLLRWSLLTGDRSAMTLGRVPHSMQTRRGRDLIAELLAPYGMEEQLVIPYQLGAQGVQAFVVSRTGEDFPDEDLLLARKLQPLFQLIDRQADALSTTPCDATAVELTGRELAILQLLDHGLTAAAIGHRLTISPRTVHKHLENVYRKLGVADRLMASRAAREAGLLGPSSTTA